MERSNASKKTAGVDITNLATEQRSFCPALCSQGTGKRAILHSKVMQRWILIIDTMPPVIYKDETKALMKRYWRAAKPANIHWMQECPQHRLGSKNW